MSNSFQGGLICILISILMLNQTAKAQQVIRCGVDEVHQQELKRRLLHHIEVTKPASPQPDITNFRIADIASRTEISIPTIVHVVHNGEAIGEGTNISYEQILSQMEVLNQDFNRHNPDTSLTPDVFLPVASRIGISFKLTPIDPNGNVLDEPGVNRMQGDQSSWDVTSITNDLMAQLQWDSRRFLNIWVVNFSNKDYLGFAYFPRTDQVEGLSSGLNFSTDSYDGMAISYRVFGSNRNGQEFESLRNYYDLGRTATHEAGHWLGLLHVWGDGGCSSDDFCTDTPLVSTSNQNIGTGSSDCTFPGPSACASDDLYDYAMFQNFMDYTADKCMNLFTHQQKDRVLDVLTYAPRRQSIGFGAPSVDITAEITSQLEGVQLTWETEETGSGSSSITHYVIERSYNSCDFTQLGIVTSDITSFDDNPLGDKGMYYYRVYAINTNGFSPSSNIVNANGQELLAEECEHFPTNLPPNPTLNEITVSPNPSEDGTFRIRFQGIPSKSTHFNLYSVDGKEILSQQGSPIINAPQLKAGMYFLIITSKNEKTCKKLIVK